MSQGSNPLPPRGASRRSAASSSSSPVKAPKKPKKKRSVLRTILLLVLAVVILAGGYLVYLGLKANEAIGQIGIEDPKGTPIPAAESVKKKSVGMVLLGLDTRAKANGMNTDVMMVAAFNPNTKSAVVVSIPRDSLLRLDGYAERKANGHYNAFYRQALEKEIDKGLSAKEAREPAEADAKRAIGEMMSQYFGIDAKYTAVINFQGFIDVVDALGGIEVDVDMDMKWSDSIDGTDIDLKKGYQLLDGDQALDFVRYRKSKDGKNMSSDFDRNKRESQVIAKIVDKMKSLDGIPKLGNVIDAVGDNMETNMPSSEIRNMMAAYFGIGSGDVQFIPLEGSWKSPYVYLDEAKLEAARAALQAKMAE
ncbi:LCP family protein [Paenibacillus sp. NEAU-GSW1]|uniref:LCP family protein n=1 Tax=Paenibacillus sp. NEAU-GSW1 TaxID=2682486 RepID=UPI0012E20C82|nr:LCP family protein [Paenibacillus sp. NEAU-GSW1]MUT66216.1 LytR family transcriptional regulator [Paenibacillus sp. NEAU-GSW1]